MKRHTQESARSHFVFTPTIAALAVAACFLQAGGALANPTGAQVAAGSAQFNTSGSTLTVTNTPGTIVNWQQFNIAAGETTRFQQQSANSAILNRVVSNNPSQIYGTLSSNGQVYLVNQNGIVFGPNSVVDVNKLVASTLNLTDANFLNRNFSFAGGGLGQLLNQGRISTPLGGSVYLIGSDVRNEGVITTPQGQVVLAAGNSVSLVDSAGPELTVTVNASGNKAVNIGTVTAAGGRIDMFGALIEQQGVLSADSAAVDAQGRIILKASDSTTVSGSTSATNSVGKGGEIQVLGSNVTLTSTANLDASGATGGGTVLVGGDWQGKNATIQNASNTSMQAGAVIKADATQNGDGGKVVLWSDGTTDFKGSIFARGGALGGNGGQVETSGHSLLLGGGVNTLAPNGAAGLWLLDPTGICFVANSSLTGNCSAFDMSASVWDSYDSMPTAPYAYITSAMSDAALSSNGTVTLQASSYFAFMPGVAGGTYTVGAMSGAKRLIIQAPYIYINGTIDARTNGTDLRVLLQANTGTTTIPGDANIPNKSGWIEFSSNAVAQLPGSGTIPNYFQIFDSAPPYTFNGTFGAQANNGIYLASGSQINVGSRANYAGSVYLRAPQINNRGASIDAGLLTLQTGGLLNAGASQPLSVNVWSAEVGPYTQGQEVHLGISSTNPSCFGFCFTDVGDLISGSWNQLHVASWGTGGMLYVDGPFTHRSANLNLGANLGLFVYSGLTVSGNLDISSKSGGVHIYAPLEGSYVFMGSETSGNVKIFSSVTGTGKLTPLIWPNEQNPYRPSVSDPTVIIGLGDMDSPSAGMTIGNFLLTNPANPAEVGSINASNGKNWMVSVPKQSVFDPQSSGLAGKDYAGYDTFEAAKAAGFFPQMSSSGDTWMMNHKPYLVGKASTSTRETDPCVLNPTSCATSSTTTITTTTTQAKVDTPLNAPLTIAATLTTDDRYLSTADKATVTGLVGEGKAGTLEAKLTTTAKLDTEKSAQEVRAEAKKAKDDAGKADTEAKQAEKEAKQAEAEAKSAKNPAQRAAARARAESKRAEAEVKKAEAEAKRAEAESREALAETKQAAGDGKSTTPVVAARRTEAEAKQIRAESKQAEAQAKQANAEAKQSEQRAKQADSEAKQAEAEVRSAKTPEQKLAATQKAEVKKTEAQAHKAEGEAKKTQAEAKQIEAQAKKAEGEAKTAENDAKQAKTPEQKAKAEKQAEAKKSEAEVKKTQAEAKQVEAEGKQAKAEGKHAEAEAKSMRSPGNRAVAEKQAAAKKAEGEHKEAQAAEKKAQADEKQARAEEKQAREAAKSEKNQQKKAEAEKKAESKKAEAEKHKAEGEKKKAEAEKKKAEAEKKAEEHRVAKEKRKEERRSEAAKAFGKIAAGASVEVLKATIALRHELKAEAMKPALQVLDHNPAAADLPSCASGAVLCVPDGMPKGSILPPPQTPTVSFLPQIQRKVALVVGVNQYSDPAIPPLETALPDALAVGQQMKDQFGYEVRSVPNASRADIITSLNALAREVGPNDSVTVYYAGHGYLNEKTDTGYWIPADAKVTSPANWISNNDIAKMLGNIPAKQVLLVSDSCYSGSMTKQQWVGSSGKVDANAILAKRSVTVMSSGGEEPVSDEGKDGHSIFAYTFMNTLKSIKQVEPAGKLFETVKGQVSKDFPQQPQYGGSISAGHTTGGDYLFEARSYK